MPVSRRKIISRASEFSELSQWVILTTLTTSLAASTDEHACITISAFHWVELLSQCSTWLISKKPQDGYGYSYMCETAYTLNTSY